MNEILDGIKVLKLYAWEPSFARKIQKIRDEEVATLKKMSYLGAVQTFMFTASPFMVALASFATFVLVDEANVLNAEVAFVSLSYFNLMRMPLNQVFILFTWINHDGVIISKDVFNLVSSSKKHEKKCPLTFHFSLG
jgi:ABC-type multidrug transport system fused ATPase/permease subunit